MLGLAGYTYDQVKVNGTVLLSTVYFDCDLNHGGGACNPEITFSRHVLCAAVRCCALLCAAVLCAV
jgi:hypothetical protein